MSEPIEALPGPSGTPAAADAPTVGQSQQSDGIRQRPTKRQPEVDSLPIKMPAPESQGDGKPLKRRRNKLSLLSWFFIIFFVLILALIVVMDWTNIMVVPLALIPPFLIIYFVYVRWLSPKLKPLGVFQNDQVVRFAFAGFLPGAFFCLLFEAGFSLLFALICLSDQLKVIADDVAKGDPQGGGVAKRIASNVTKTAGFWIFLVLTSYITAATVEEVMKACVLRLNICGACFGPEEEMCVQKRVRMLPRKGGLGATLADTAAGKEGAGSYLYESDSDDDHDDAAEDDSDVVTANDDDDLHSSNLYRRHNVSTRGKTPRIMAYSTLALLIAVGFGFSTAENLLYIFAESFQTPLRPHLSLVASKAMLAAVRGIVSMPVHCICVGYTALRLTLRDMQLYKKEILEEIGDNGGEWVETAIATGDDATPTKQSPTPLSPAVNPFNASAPKRYHMVYSPSQAQKDADAVNVWSWPRILWPSIALHGTFDLMALCVAAAFTSTFGDGLVTSLTLVLGMGILLLSFWILTEQYDDVFERLERDAFKHNNASSNGNTNGDIEGKGKGTQHQQLSVAEQLADLPTSITGGTLYRLLSDWRQGKCGRGSRCKCCGEGREHAGDKASSPAQSPSKAAGSSEDATSPSANSTAILIKPMLMALPSTTTTLSLPSPTTHGSNSPKTQAATSEGGKQKLLPEGGSAQ